MSNPHLNDHRAHDLLSNCHLSEPIRQMSTGRCGGASGHLRYLRPHDSHPHFVHLREQYDLVRPSFMTSHFHLLQHELASWNPFSFSHSSSPYRHDRRTRLTPPHMPDARQEPGLDHGGLPLRPGGGLSEWVRRAAVMQLHRQCRQHARRPRPGTRSCLYHQDTLISFHVRGYPLGGFLDGIAPGDNVFMTCETLYSSWWGLPEWSGRAASLQLHRQRRQHARWPRPGTRSQWIDLAS
jgi:hypothetical protein